MAPLNVPPFIAKCDDDSPTQVQKMDLERVHLMYADKTIVWSWKILRLSFQPSFPPRMPRVQRIPNTKKGYLYTAKSPRRECILFPCEVPLNENHLNPRIVRAEKMFSLHDGVTVIHEAVVHNGRFRFLIVGYHSRNGPRNRALEDVLPDIHWHGEIAVLFLGTRRPFIESPRGSPSRSIGRFFELLGSSQSTHLAV
ncbi:hypothetical protein IW261DRAFT_1426348 [Armillaria novae-zelandiae]|uniref:Uncharacterized protein n=1 Tax=Armillaria novae-zelandiae TaxID=153914 RepID=A0AA39NMR6_9AGAR|nr:hypothetical protein IW261DRAFT_1426348 [Armillaria novae-zelandiae]